MRWTWPFVLLLVALPALLLWAFLSEGKARSRDEGRAASLDSSRAPRLQGRAPLPGATRAEEDAPLAPPAASPAAPATASPIVPGIIAGRVIPPPGEVLHDVDVTLVRIGLPSRGETVWRAVAWAQYDGQFLFGAGSGLPEATYEVSASAWRHGPPVVTQRVALHDHSVQLRLPPIDRSQGVFLWVLDSEGRPFEPERVRLAVRARDATGKVCGGEATVHGMPDGRLWTPTSLPGFGPATSGDVSFLVRAGELGARCVEVSAEAASAPLLVRFDPPVEVRLRFQGRSDWLAERLQLFARLPSYGYGWDDLHAPLSPGEVVHAGALQLVAHGLFVVGGADGWRISLDLGVVRPAASEEILVALPPLHPVRFELPGPLPLAIQGPGISATRDADAASRRGRREVLLPGLPEGQYEVRRQGTTGMWAATLDLGSVHVVPGEGRNARQSDSAVSARA